ncbi:MAG TPA: ABC transporter permease [Gemmatimonadaceae bacterium]|jgi:predicted permease
MTTGKRIFTLPWRSRTTIAHDVDAELSFHFDMRIAELRARGLSEGDARQQAAAEFGDLEFTRSYCRREDEHAVHDQRWTDRLTEWRQDLVYAVRTLRRSPGFALASLITLAIAIGANTAVFAVSRAVLLQPLPYADADRLYQINTIWPNQPNSRNQLSPADFADFQRTQTSFTDLGAVVPETAMIWRPASGDPKSLDALDVSSNTFAVLGTRALYGRTLLPGDEIPGHDHRVVLSFDTWQRDFGGDVAVTGRSIILSGASYDVVGVMPRGFTIDEREEIWLPYDQTGTLADVVRARKQHYVRTIGRLKTGITPAHGLADLRTIAARLAAAYPEADSGRTAEMRSLHDVLTGDLRPALLLLQGAAALVLLIACANLANLALSRTMGRRRELATRAALGASRGRLVRQLVTESVVVSIAGGILGVGLAVVGTRSLLALNPTTLPSLFDANVNGGVLAFSLAVSLITGVLFGLLPALDASGGNLHDSLKEGGRGSSGGRASGRARTVLVVAQVALALMLLAGAGLLVRSFAQLTRVTLGYDPNGIVTADLRAAGDRYNDSLQVTAFYDGVIQQLSRMPGVTAVAAVSDVPTRGSSGTALRIDGQENDEARLQDLRYISVHGDFFKTMRIPIVAGRAYDTSDRPDIPETAILNETAAKRYFPKGDVLGHRIRIGPDPNAPWMTVIGIAGDIHTDGLDVPVEPTIYANHRHEAWMRSMSLVMRTSLSAANAGPLIRAAVRAEDPTLAVNNVETLNDVLGQSLASRRFALGLAMSFALIALVLAALGIYGVLAYNVAARTREFGVRIALGASSRGVVSLVVQQGVSASLAGIVIGLAGAALGARLLNGMLFGVTPLDASTYVIVVTVLLVVAVVACAVPAWRATRVDPLTSMRAE